MGLRAAIVGVSIVIAGVVVGFFVTQYMGHTPPTVTVSTSANTVEGRPVVDVTFTTVAAVGSGLHPNWVAYLNSDGNPSTYFHVPAGSVVRITIDQQDGASGLRNPYFGLVRGTVGNEMTVNHKVMKSINPDDAAHTFTIPDLGVSVPLLGVADNAPAGAQNVVQFEFIAPPQGTYRWQCFVPCAAGTLYGNGGPMQTLGYMAGEMTVS